MRREGEAVADLSTESVSNDKEKENTNNGWWKLQKTDLNVSNDQFGVGNDKTDKDYKADAN